jgi:nitrate reductase gamma subunit
MTNVDFLAWVRGPAFEIAVAVFVLGTIVRLLETFMLGREPDLSEPRQGAWRPGMKTVFRRFGTDRATFRRDPFTIVLGYVFHMGFLMTLVWFVPHIQLFDQWLGVRWPGLPNPLIDATAVITIFALLAVLVYRIVNPVRRFLSQFEDYLVWTLTLLPLLTGYLAYHRLLVPYDAMLGMHILSVEVLLVVFPFTKLMHAFTLWPARWYNGAIAGRKGIQS